MMTHSQLFFPYVSPHALHLGWGMIIFTPVSLHLPAPEAHAHQLETATSMPR